LFSPGPFLVIKKSNNDKSGNRNSIHGMLNSSSKEKK